MKQVVVGLFDDFSDAQNVLRELTETGVPRDHISVIGSVPPDERRETPTTEPALNGGTAEATLDGATAGATLGAGVGLVAGITSLFLPGLGPLVAAGWIASTVGGAAIGAVTGGLLGALSSEGIPEEQAGFYVEGLRRGGTLVVVRTESEESAEIARNVMQRHDAVNIDERAADWRTRGWPGFDPEAEALAPDELEQERSRYRRAA